MILLFVKFSADLRLVFTEEENKSLKTELSELRARQKLELEKIRKDKEKEMEQVHERYDEPWKCFARCIQYLYVLTWSLQ